MKVIIQLTDREERRALPILLRHSVGMVLAGRKYILSEEAVTALKKEGISFVEISREAGAPTLEGSGTGERI